MSFINDQQIPACCLRLGRSCRVRREKVNAAEDELTIQKRIRFGIMQLDRCATLLVEETEQEIEPAQKFNKPLMNQRLRNQNKGAFRASGQIESMQYQTGFNSFAETNLIGQQNARHKARSHFGR